MNIPEDLLYTKEHEWARVEGKKAKFGITDYAQSSLGDITFIELPDEQKEIEQAKPYSTVESVKAASDVYAPLSGKVVDINSSLLDKPEAVNSAPYEEGWFIQIEIKDEKEKDSLMSAADYKKYIEGIK